MSLTTGPLDRNKNHTPPDHTDLSELQKIEDDLAASFEQFRLAEGAYMSGTPASSQIAAQQFSQRFQRLLKHYAQPPVVADEELDSLIETLGDICHEQYLGTEQVDGQWYYSYRNEVINMLQTPKAKAALLQREQRLVAEALDDYMQDLKNVARDYAKKYPDADINDFIGLIVGTRNQPQRKAQLRHNTNTGKDE